MSSVVITGAAGFLGARLASALLNSGTLGGAEITELVLVDRGELPADLRADPRVRPVRADLGGPDVFGGVIDRDTRVVFHLAAVVSGQAEADFDLGMQVNLDATLALLEAARATGTAPRIVFASSVAVFGGPPPPIVTSTTAVQPQSSYGTQKAIGELLVAEYARKGFVDGRVVRLPTISVRPGAPNAAASSFLSGIVREPLAGSPAAVPVPRTTRVWLMSPARVIDALIAVAALPAHRWAPGRC